MDYVLLKKQARRFPSIQLRVQSVSTNHSYNRDLMNAFTKTFWATRISVPFPNSVCDHFPCISPSNVWKHEKAYNIENIRIPFQLAPVYQVPVTMLRIWVMVAMLWPGLGTSDHHNKEKVEHAPPSPMPEDPHYDTAGKHNVEFDHRAISGKDKIASRGYETLSRWLSARLQ